MTQRWPEAFRLIINRLLALRRLTPQQADSLLGMLPRLSPIQIKDAVYRELGSVPPDWNKVWIQDELVGWYGRITTALPLRLLTILFRSEPEAELVRNLANRIFVPEGSNLQDSREVLGKHLGNYALEPFSDQNRNFLKFLQRLNLDQRELPVIDKWRWSRQGGTAWVSDGGRLVITLETAWAWAVESSLNQYPEESGSILEFLRSLKPQAPECFIPSTLRSDSVNSLIDRLVSFDLASDFGETLSWRGFPGLFPQEGAEYIWGFSHFREAQSLQAGAKPQIGQR